MPRSAAVVALCAVLAATGCGGGGGSSTRAPAGPTPVHPGGGGQRGARDVAAYRTAVDAVLSSYSVAQRRAFRSLHGAADATAFGAALGRLRRATVGAADRLAAQRPPAPAAAPHQRFVAAFRALARVLRSAIDARRRADFPRLRRLGRRLASGELSRPIVDAARQIDAALRPG
jgi:predicted lipid-binding transport protein (Tim44 family)